MWSFNIRDWIILFVCALWVVVCSYAQTPIIGVDIGTEHFYSRQLNGTNPGYTLCIKIGWLGIITIRIKRTLHGWATIYTPMTLCHLL